MRQISFIEMCCLLKKRLSSPPRRRPPAFQQSGHRHGSHGSHGHGTSSASTSTRPSSSTAFSNSDFSSTSVSSVASIKEVLPDGPLIFKFSEISTATDNFSQDKQISRSVWKASLRDLKVAISKKLGCSPRYQRSLRKINHLHHSSLVKLIGACHEGENLYLVYEFVESSTLADCLCSKHNVNFSPLSSWFSRLQIALDVAKGLEYLHHHASPPIIHKYIDSRNVLVGNNLRAKLAHVGVSVLTGEVDIMQGKITEEVSEATRNVEIQSQGEIQIQSPGRKERRLGRSRSIKISGKKGYMPPEYLFSGEITPKYDVYAFGVILAELLSGRGELTSPRPGRYEQKKFSQFYDVLEDIMLDPDPKSKLRLWMDPLLKDSYPLDDALRLASITRSCLHPEPEKRPQMSDVASNLLKSLTLAQKWEASRKAQQEIMSISLQPR